tara:strand:- start:659 stop:826 length:168 start_codon:yes stop_codon:yes gene_type:complete
MILKFIAILFVGVFLLKLMFARKLRGLGKEIDTLVNIFLIVIAIYIVAAGIIQIV